MCGRYLLTSPVDALIDLFGVQERLNLAPNYNAAPTQSLPIVRARDGGGRELVSARWGLVPFWAKDLTIGARAFNARAETLAEKPMFRDAYRRRRCLVPADGFYEWRKTGGAKQPFLIRVKGGRTFAFAGLWERWGKDAETVTSFTIVTTEANAFMAELHDRMPVILDPRDWASWLEPQADEGAALLRPCPDGWLERWPVSPRVGNVRNNDPRLIEPLADQASLL
jgi:putative SOS response-associated peptidase YedK